MTHHEANVLLGERRAGETEATLKWSRIMYWPLSFAALAFLITYTIHVIGDLHGLAAMVTTTVITLTWVLFIVDYFGRLALSRPRGAWFRSHLASLGMVLIPALRPVRLLDAFTRVAAFRRTAGTTLRARLLIYGIGSALLHIWYLSLVVLQFERHAPGANILNFGDAVWWAFCTITTVGYGDYTPVTHAGRFFAIVLMAGGVVLVGVIVATISSAVTEKAAPSGAHHAPHPHHAGGEPPPVADAASDPSRPASAH